MSRIRFLTPTFPEPDAVADSYAEIVASGRFTNGGPKEQQFNAEIARHVGNGVAVAVVASGTAALQLACRAAFAPGRRPVLVPSFTFAAVPLALLSCGYEPVFFDIDSCSWHGSTRDVAAALADGAEAFAGIVLTNTFGVANPHIDEWEALARRCRIPLVIDSAAGFGATYPSGEPLGARGDCEIFSFHATKVLAIGEGGAVVSRDPRLIERVEQLRNFGLDGDEVVAAGTNAKLPELASAIGILQLGGLGERVARRRRIVDQYRCGLEALGFTFQSALSHAAVPFVSARCASEAGRAAFGRGLDRAEIEWRAYYNPPLHRHRLFASSRSVGSLSMTEALAECIISLPLSDSLSADEVCRIVDVAAASRDG